MVSSLEGHDNEVKCCAWSASGSLLATCGRDKKVWIWENVGGTEFECVAMLEGHSQDVKSVKWHPLYDILFSASYDDTIKVWVEDGGDWYCRETLNGHTSTVWSCSVSASGNQFVSCSDDLSVKLWECERPDASGKWNTVLTIKNAHEYPIYSIDWSHHHEYIASAGGDNAIVVFHRRENDSSSIEQLYRLPSAHEGDVNGVRWNPSAEKSYYLLSVGDDSLVKLWQLVI